MSSAPKVNKAMRYNNNNMDYWKIRQDLPPESREIVARTIAAMYLYRHAPDHHIVPVPFSPVRPAENLYVTGWYSLRNLSEAQGIPLQELRWLNPLYKKDVIPDTEEKYLLRVPAAYQDSAAAILQVSYEPFAGSGYGEPETATDPQADQPEEENTAGLKKISHVVKKGETLQKIAVRYSCSVNDIKRWNSLASGNLVAGKKLVIYVPATRVTAPATAPKKTAPAAYYTVRSGDNLSSIAKRHHCTVAQLKKWNNLSSDNIRAGQKLKVSGN